MTESEMNARGAILEVKDKILEDFFGEEKEPEVLH